MRYRLKALWFDPNAVRRRPGIIYTGDDKIADQLPSGAEIIGDDGSVIEVVDRKNPKPKQVVEVEISTDPDADVKVDGKTKIKL